MLPSKKLLGRSFFGSIGGLVDDWIDKTFNFDKYLRNTQKK